jgi:hypothetical protein
VNYQLLSDLTLMLMIRAINSELNVISRHYHKDDGHAREEWEKQYNALNPVYSELIAEDARRKYMSDFPPNPITDRSFA